MINYDHNFPYWLIFAIDLQMILPLLAESILTYDLYWLIFYIDLQMIRPLDLPKFYSTIDLFRSTIHILLQCTYRLSGPLSSLFMNI